MRPERLYPIDILEAADAIAGFLAGVDEETFMQDELRRSAVLQKVVAIGDADNAMEIARGHGIFVVDGSKCRLAFLEDRAGRRGLGMDPNPPLIDALHRALLLSKEEKRGELVGYLAERGLLEDGPFWKPAQALFEVLPRDLEDWKLVNALLGERPTLWAEGRKSTYQEDQRRLF